MVVVLSGLSACGTAKLDRQQQEATSRECISLLDRHAARGPLVFPFRLGGETYDLGRDASSFYSALAQARGPDAFPIDASGESDTGRQDVVRRKCTASDPSKSSSGSSRSTGVSTSASTNTTTTTTTTSTTASTTDG
jgi:hypothetical protein